MADMLSRAINGCSHYFTETEALY
eukprot:COSAG02_NODE_30149_length_556_cov_1.059081_1_plen_23_part_10